MKWLMTLSNKSKLPYDAEVEYLESTGTQWIDTGILPDNYTGMYVDMAFSENRSFYGDSWILGCKNDSGNTRFIFGISDTLYGGFSDVVQSGIRVDQYTRFQQSINYCNDRKYVVDYNNTHNEFSFSQWLPSFDYSVFIFGRNSFGTYKTYPYLVYGFKMTHNNDIVLDFIPVRVGQVGYMYDRVSGKLFGNQGTGSFVLGPDVKTFGCMTTKNKVTAKSYVQDGLVAMWDGIENVGYGQHDSSSTVWHDLKRSEAYSKMTIEPANQQLIKFDDNSLISFGKGQYFYNTLSGLTNLPQDKMTAQCIFAVDDDGGEDRQMAAISLGSFNLRFAYTRLNAHKCGIYWSGVNEFTKSIPLPTTAICQTIVKGEKNVSGKPLYTVYDNDAQLYSANLADQTQFGSSSIILNYVSNNYKFVKLYALRLYNRALTPDEIRHNYNIDKVRFGI